MIPTQTVLRQRLSRIKASLIWRSLTLARSTVRAPVDDYVANLRLRPGDYVTAGVTKVAVLDAASFWITCCFEETKIRQIRIVDRARIVLMGFDWPVSGHVESLGRGIDNSNDAPGHLGLPTVAATFSWGCLVQHIPVRIQIDQVPSGIELAARMTATVEILTSDVRPERASGHYGHTTWPLLDELPNLFRSDNRPPPGTRRRFRSQSPMMPPLSTVLSAAELQLRPAQLFELTSTPSASAEGAGS